MFYHPASNQHIREGNPFTIDGVQYPSNWLNLSTPEQKTALGLVEVTTVGTREDDRYFYVSEELVGAERRIINTPKSAEQIAEMERAQKLSEIDRLEREAMVPRVVREFMLAEAERRAIEAGHTIEELRAGHFGYRKTKELDEQIAALRGSL